MPSNKPNEPKVVTPAATPAATPAVTPVVDPVVDPLAPEGTPAVDDAAAIIGGPGQSETAVEVTIGERTYLVEPEVAAVIAAGGQPPVVTPVATPAATPASVATPPPAAAPATPGLSLEETLAGGPIAGGPVGTPTDDENAAANEVFQQRLWDNPLEVFNEAKAEAKKEIKAELAAEATMASNTNEFWNDFYIAHKDLTRDDSMVIDAVVSRHFKEVVKLPPTEAASRIAELSRVELLRIRGGSPTPSGDNPTPALRTNLESGSGGAPVPTDPSANEGGEVVKGKEGSLTAHLQKRAAKRAAVG